MTNDPAADAQREAIITICTERAIQNIQFRTFVAKRRAPIPRLEKRMLAWSIKNAILLEYQDAR